jgi:hypothetical protein
MIDQGTMREKKWSTSPAQGMVPYCLGGLNGKPS